MKNNTTNRYTAEGVIADKIIAELNKGVCPWRKPWRDSRKGYLRSIHGHVYRGINLLILQMFAAEYETPVFLTFAQANKMGGRVRKGEKGFPIVFWQRKFYPVRNEDGTPKINEEDGSPYMKSYLVARTYTVFNVHQCDGLPESVFADPKEVTFDNKEIKTATGIVDGYETCPPIKHEGNVASYNPVIDRIRMPRMEQFEDSESYYLTLFHEMGHSTGHASRLNRVYKEDGKDTFRSATAEYGFEELVAEITAQMLASEAGITGTLSASAAYCASWAKALKDAPAKSILLAAAHAQRAADYILGVEPSTEEDEKQA